MDPVGGLQMDLFHDHKLTLAGRAGRERQSRSVVKTVNPCPAVTSITEESTAVMYLQYQKTVPEY